MNDFTVYYKGDPVDINDLTLKQLEELSYNWLITRSAMSELYCLAYSPGRGMKYNYAEKEVNRINKAIKLSNQFLRLNR